MPDYFVWYRLAGEADDARRQVDALQRDLAARTGAVARLLARSDENPPTWMEVYAGVVDAAAFERELADAVVRHEALRFARDGQRHAERFDEFPAVG